MSVQLFDFSFHFDGARAGYNNNKLFPVNLVVQLFNQVQDKLINCWLNSDIFYKKKAEEFQNYKISRSDTFLKSYKVKK